MVVLAFALHAFGVYPRRVAAIFFLTIVLSGLFWGSWPAIIAALGGVLLIDYFLISPPTAFSVPSIREAFLLSGLLAAGLVVGAFARRMPEVHQKVRGLTQNGQLQRALLAA
jgi:K+-sensing histidine kinase KdpD